MANTSAWAHDTVRREKKIEGLVRDMFKLVTPIQYPRADVGYAAK